jgi:hypothetical protein
MIIDHQGNVDQRILVSFIQVVTVNIFGLIKKSKLKN